MRELIKTRAWILTRVLLLAASLQAFEVMSQSENGSGKGSGVKKREGTASPTHSGTILVDASMKSVVSATKPDAPRIVEDDCLKGGLDENSKGDSKAFFLAGNDTRWGGRRISPESISIHFSLADGCEKVYVTVGYFAGRYLTRRFDIFLDGKCIKSVRRKTYGVPKPEDRKLMKIEIEASISPESPKRHVLEIRQRDFWGCTYTGCGDQRGRSGSFGSEDGGTVFPASISLIHTGSSYPRGRAVRIRTNAFEDSGKRYVDVLSGKRAQRHVCKSSNGKDNLEADG